MWNWKTLAPAAVFCVALSAAQAADTAAQAVSAPVEVAHAWARASVQGQQATGAFMQLTAKENLRLVGVQTPVAESGEVHEMRMDGDVMRMRQLDGLDLPEGRMVELKPGGYHLMFQQLKAPLLEGTQVPVTLLFKDEKGEVSRLQMQVPVKRMATAAGPSKPSMDSPHHRH